VPTLPRGNDAPIENNLFPRAALRGDRRGHGMV